MRNGIPLEEQETVIVMNPKQVSDTAEIYTCMPNMLKRIRKMAESRPDCVRIKRDDGDALFADVARSCIKISPKRQLSNEQRQAAAARLEKARSMLNDPG